MKQRDLMLLLVPSFIVVAAWIIFNIYHSSVSSTISQNLDMQIISISPIFDLKTIDSIKKREQVAPIYESSALPSSTPIPAVVPGASFSATQTQQASSSSSN